MIRLQSIRVRNFRAIREASFKPLDEGITGIFGTNGAGKTTFLAATLFALFGVKPPGASVASLRRTGSGKEECSASVVFTHLNQTIEVIRELKGSNNRVIVDIYVDGVPQTVTSVGAADAWIAQRLGVDATGFMTAFIVRQKELDALVNARPAERKQVIEKLAGIETINEALKKARKEENVAREVLGTLPGSESNIAEAESQVLFLTTKVEELGEEKEKQQNALHQYQSAQKTLNDELENLRLQESKLFKNTTLLDSLKSENKLHEDTVAQLAYLNNIEDDFDIEGLRQQHRDIVQKITELNQHLNAVRVKKASSNNTIAELTQEANLLKGHLDESSVDPSVEKSLAEEYAEIEKELVELNNARSSALARETDLLESIKLLEHSTDCPTCHTHLSDPASLVESLNASAEKFAHEAFVAKENIDLKIVRQAEIDAELHNIKVFNDWQTRYTEALSKLESSKVELSELADESDFETQIVELEKEKEKVAETGIKAKDVLNDRNRLQAARQKLVQNSQQIEQLERELIDLKKTFSETKLQEAKVKRDRNQTETDRLAKQVNEIFAEFSGFESRLSVANHNYKTATEQWKRKKDLLVAQEKRALTTELLDKFRQDSVASLAPELSEYATELISDITNGSYTEIRLDDEFNVSVVSATGDVRSVSWLSGGEESAVAFALRLAIAFLITGGNPSLLWLDEVLTAQDQDRRMAMLSTIRNLPIDQIIMINHTQEASDIVDKVVTVIPDVVNGSTLETDENSSNVVPTLPDDLDAVADDEFF